MARRRAEARWRIAIREARTTSGSSRSTPAATERQRRRADPDRPTARRPGDQGAGRAHVESPDGRRRPPETRDRLTVERPCRVVRHVRRESPRPGRTTVFGYREVFDNWLKDRDRPSHADRLTPPDRRRLRPHAQRRHVAQSNEQRPRCPQRRLQVGPPPRQGATQPDARLRAAQEQHSAPRDVAPESRGSRRLSASADEHDPEIAPVLKLAATTGMRRGELSGLRRDRSTSTEANFESSDHQ